MFFGINVDYLKLVLNKNNSYQSSTTTLIKKLCASSDNILNSIQGSDLNYLTDSIVLFKSFSLDSQLNNYSQFIENRINSYIKKDQEISSVVKNIF